MSWKLLQTHCTNRNRSSSISKNDKCVIGHNAIKAQDKHYNFSLIDTETQRRNQNFVDLQKAKPRATGRILSFASQLSDLQLVYSHRSYRCGEH